MVNTVPADDLAPGCQGISRLSDDPVLVPYIYGTDTWKVKNIFEMLIQFIHFSTDCIIENLASTFL